MAHKKMIVGGIVALLVFLVTIIAVAMSINSGEDVSDATSMQATPDVVGTSAVSPELPITIDPTTGITEEYDSVVPTTQEESQQAVSPTRTGTEEGDDSADEVEIVREEKTGGPEICTDGKDNDGDGFVDLEDFDCTADEAPGASGISRDADLKDQVNDVLDESATDDVSSAVCGSDHGQVLSSPPAGVLCIGDTVATNQTGKGPWQWACEDPSGAVVALCESAVAQVSEDVKGECGATLNSCVSGTFIDQGDSNAQHLWGCIGSGGFENFAECSIAK